MEGLLFWIKICVVAATVSVLCLPPRRLRHMSSSPYGDPVMEIVVGVFFVVLIMLVAFLDVSLAFLSCMFVLCLLSCIDPGSYRSSSATPPRSPTARLWAPAPLPPLTPEGDTVPLAFSMGTRSYSTVVA